MYALQALRDTGSSLPIARNLREGSNRQPARDNARDLEHLSEAFLSALPLELGWQARNVLDHRRKPLRRLLRDDHRLPLAEELVGHLAETLGRAAFPESVLGDGWKRQIRLSRIELERQAGIIDDLIGRGDFATALRLMREWLVSWAVYQQAPDDDWLNRDVRQRAERLLHAIRTIGDDRHLRGALTEDQRRLGAFWNDLAEVRNAYAHHGMRGDDLLRDRTVAAARKRVLCFWKRTLRSCPAVSLAIGESRGGRVLVSPVGFRPGVVFSAVQAARANGGGEGLTLCLVICSHETEGMIAEALGRAGFTGKYTPLVLEDAVARRSRRDQTGG